MKVVRLEITNIKCFEKCFINLSPTINVIVGANNSGKSTILNCISILQQPRIVGQNYNRLRQQSGTISLDIRQDSIQYFSQTINGVFTNANNIFTTTDRGEIECKLLGSSSAFRHPGLPNVEPENYIVPYLSKRKVGGYSEGIRIEDVNQVHGNLSNLYAKIDRISNPEYLPAYAKYIKACDEILGFRVTTSNSTSGKKGAYIVRNDENIPIDSMGEGITNLLGLIVDLCRVEKKLFIIEEPENDIHPKALKKLLDLIISVSTENQFIITTHSNIVIRHLVANVGSKLFNVEMEFKDRIPTSVVEEVDTPQKRKTVLENLGYELFDYELWDYWLFFEESSAERLIREFLIPWFFPTFSGKVRTFSASSTSQIATKFSDFNNLFVYLHLQPIYKNKVWVIIDAGQEEKKIIEKMKEKYIPKGWNEDTFSQFDRHDFEEYYPQCFQQDVTDILSIKDKKQKQERKSLLRERVITWIQEKPEEAKREFELSAANVIDKLKTILKP